MNFTCDHLHLRSPDPEGSAARYVALFDATVSDRAKIPTGVRIIVDLAGLRLLIDQVPTETHGAPALPFVGIEHIGLRVPDLDSAVAKLREKGARFLVEPTSPRPGVKIAFVEGPDNLRVEILERSAA